MSIPDEQIIQNSHLNRLYKHTIKENLECFRVVSEEITDDITTTFIQMSPRIQFKITYSIKSEDVKSFTITKVARGKSTGEVKLNNSSLIQLKAFLEFITTFNLSDIRKNKVRLVYGEEHQIDKETQRQVFDILKNQKNISLIKEVLNNQVITSEDIVNTGYRKSELNKFNRLLNDQNYLSDFKSSILNNPAAKDEKAWQEFFKLNEWIFGYGLDYKFQGILQDEFHASSTNISGKEAVISDYLLGDTNFTSFVEIKLPTTELFSESKNRSRCWKLSRHLIDAFSQILEQKASGQVRFENNHNLYDANGNYIKQKSYDSKTILIIGNLTTELSNISDSEKETKLKTWG